MTDTDTEKEKVAKKLAAVTAVVGRQTEEFRHLIVSDTRIIIVRPVETDFGPRVHVDMYCSCHGDELIATDEPILLEELWGWVGKFHQW